MAQPMTKKRVGEMTEEELGDWKLRFDEAQKYFPNTDMCKMRFSSAKEYYYKMVSAERKRLAGLYPPANTPKPETQPERKTEPVSKPEPKPAKAQEEQEEVVIKKETIEKKETPAGAERQGVQEFVIPKKEIEVGNPIIIETVKIIE